MAAKFFTGLPLDGPDPECVQGYGEAALAAVQAGSAPKPTGDHSHRGPVRGQPGRAGPALRQPVPITLLTRRPDRACDENPLAGLPAGEFNGTVHHGTSCMR